MSSLPSCPGRRRLLEMILDNLTPIDAVGRQGEDEFIFTVMYTHVMDMDIYLDIDGVLLNGDRATDYAHSFLEYVLTNYPDTTYWLTTRCNGDANATVAQISHLFDESTQRLIERIKPTSWPIIKTQAINFSRPFLWFDDQLGYADKQTLLEHDCLDNLIKVDLKIHPDILQSFIADFPLPV